MRPHDLLVVSLSSFIGVSCLSLGVWASFNTEQITFDFLMDAVFAAGGATLTFAYSYFRARSREAEEIKQKQTDIKADLFDYQVNAIESGNSDGDFFLKEHVEGFAYTQVSHSYAAEQVELITGNINAATSRLEEIFGPLSQCPEFDRAWDLYYVLQFDIRNASSNIKELRSIIHNLEGKKDIRKLDAADEDKEIQDIYEKAGKSYRAIGAGLVRRNEAYVHVPSLETFKFSRTESRQIDSEIDDYGKLSCFWILFNIATKDMRFSYFYIRQIIERVSKNPRDDFDAAKKALGACLERLRNCVRILDQKVDSEQQGNQEGNTIISNEDLDSLVDCAKKIERGADVSGDSNKIDFLPASFGVMIRDLATAYRALGGGNNGENKGVNGDGP